MVHTTGQTGKKSLLQEPDGSEVGAETAWLPGRSAARQVTTKSCPAQENCEDEAVELEPRILLLFCFQSVLSNRVAAAANACRCADVAGMLKPEC